MIMKWLSLSLMSAILLAAPVTKAQQIDVDELILVLEELQEGAAIEPTLGTDDGDGVQITGGQCAAAAVDSCGQGNVDDFEYKRRGVHTSCRFGCLKSNN